jgi:glycosyltransferase involved in cell wall biosynthesis
MLDVSIIILNYNTLQLTCNCIGSIIEFKGHKDAILLIKNLKSLGLNVYLNIVGDGLVTYVKYLKQLANDLGVSENINWLGFQKDTSIYIKKSDILIVCSLYETFGMTILEAMYNKCPVIATRVGGITEIIINEYNGLLYSPKDINMLTNCVIKLNNIEFYNKLCKNGTKIINKKFNVEFYAESIINKIKCLLIQ